MGTRKVGLFAITVYAVGDILGAGIYALVGRVAGEAGGGAWASFVVSAAVAALTGLTYAELVSRYPLAAGAAVYTSRAFGLRSLAFLVGVLVLASGITSAAAVSRAFVGYLDSFVHVPPELASTVLLVGMSALSYMGLHQSSRVNIALTAAELGGLLFVVGAGVWFLLGPGEPANVSLQPAGILPVVAGTTVAFYAYVGFEDAVNVAEEVENPSRNLPRAILIAIALTSVIYIGVMLVALAVVPLDRLAASKAPLLEVLNYAGVGVPTRAFAAVALLAIVNTGLLNLIMASRLSYGMGREGLMPAILTKLHPVRRTPWVAILAALVVAVALALSGGAQVLAQTTSLLLVTVFATVHVALILLHRRHPRSDGGFGAPRWVPWVGAVCCLGLLTQFPFDVWLRAGAVIAAGAAGWAIFGRRR